MKRTYRRPALNDVTQGTPLTPTISPPFAAPDARFGEIHLRR